MKRILPVIFILFFLSACASESPAQIADNVSEAILNADSISMTAQVTADYGQRVYIFKLRMCSIDDGWRVEVIEPENISNVAAVIRSDSTSLEYEGMILDTGDLDPMGLSPMNCLPTIVTAWRNGHVEEALRFEDNGQSLVSISYTISDSTAVSTVFEEKKLLPLNAQITVNGYTAIQCSFDNVVFE